MKGSIIIMLKGQVVFNKNGYGLFNRGDYINLEENLNQYLTDNIHMTIKNIRENNNEEITYDKEGLFKKENDLGGKLWRYYVGESCLDNFLWNLVDSCETINIQIEVIKVNYALSEKDLTTEKGKVS